MTTRIVFLDDYQGAAVRLAPLDRLAGLDRLPDAEVVVVRDHLEGDELIEAIGDAPVVVAMRERTAFDRALFERLPSLQLLCTTGPANAAIDLAAAADSGVVVSATEGAASGNTAELTWALILSVLRHLPTELANVSSGGWQTTIGTELAGSTLGIVGLGRIGSRMAKVARAFEMEVIAWSEHLDAERAAGAGARAVDKATLFSTADVVSVHYVLSDRSRGLVGEAELRSMKPSAILVNTSRGPVVDQAALLRALEEGWIAGAGLDVFAREPLPVDHPLRHARRAVVTPHIGYVTDRVLAAWYADIVDDVVAWSAGEPIRVLTS